MTLNSNEISEIVEFVVALLSDQQVEVRELAKEALVSLFTGNETGKNFVEKFENLASLPIPSRNKRNLSSNIQNQEELKKNIVPRHAGILGLSSLVLSNPYSLPSWLPAVIILVGDHLRDPSPISDSVKKTISEFFRTHQDNWDHYSSLLTSEQLNSIMELKSGASLHNYFN